MLYFNQLDQLLDNGPCQKGRVMMISFAFFQASCAWSAMAILVMICVLKKSSCSLIDERLGLAFGKMYSISLWCLCQLHKFTNDCASMLGIVRGVFCSYGGQIDWIQISWILQCKHVDICMSLWSLNAQKWVWFCHRKVAVEWFAMLARPRFAWRLHFDCGSLVWWCFQCQHVKWSYCVWVQWVGSKNMVVTLKIRCSLQ